MSDRKESLLEESSIQLGHSPVLFLDGAAKPMEFVIRPCKDEEALREMIEYGGGEVVPTPELYGITLASPDVDIVGNEEIFSTEYINDCCTKNKIQDIKKYRLCSDPRFPEKFDVMDILLKYTCWPDALRGIPYSRRVGRRRENRSDREKSFEPLDNVGGNADGSNTGRVKKCEKKSPIILHMLWPGNESGKLCHEEKVFSEATGRFHSKLKQTQAEVSDSETEEIPQSKQRREVVANKGDDFPSKVTEFKMKDNNENTASSSSEQGLNVHPNFKRIPKSSIIFKSSQKDSSSEVEYISDDEDTRKIPITKSKKRGVRPGRKEYVESERQAIVAFVSKTRCHNFVKGREIWQKAEAKQICPGRTWQSMKEHFIKKIIPNIKSYNLSDEEVRKFKKPFH